MNKYPIKLMIAVQLAVIPALFGELLSWMVGLVTLFLCWRFLYEINKATLPTVRVTSMFAAACGVVLVVLATQTGFLASMVNLLFLGGSLKLLACRNEWDFKVSIWVNYFLISTVFIFNQDIYLAIVYLSIFALNTYCLIKFFAPKQTNKLQWHTTLKIMAMSFPIAITLFLLVPRLGPIWNVKQPKNASTGLSEEVSPGNISQLAQSSELAFRATFPSGYEPKRTELYWRAMVHESFDGERWTIHPVRKERELFEDRGYKPIENPHTVEIIAEPHQRNFLYSYQYPVSVSSDVYINHDSTLLKKHPLAAKFRYQVNTSDASRHDGITHYEQGINIETPSSGNDRAKQLGRQLRNQYINSADYEIKIANVLLSMFNEEPFRYTLRPPPLFDDHVDEFLFQTKAGFCGHYASAFTFVMRSAGIPARVVTGYQGGEINPNTGNINVYQFDAHAWSEIWVRGEGWRRIDPTAAVAPSRVEMGLEAAMQQEDSFLENSGFSLYKFKDIPALNWLRLKLATIDFYWARWVLGFDQNKQYSLLNKLLKGYSALKYTLLFASVIVVIAIILYLLSNQGVRPKQAHRVDQILILLENRLRKLGIHRKVSETVAQFLQRLATSYPASASDIDVLLNSYHKLAFENKLATNDELDVFEKQAKQLNLKQIDANKK